MKEIKDNYIIKERTVYEIHDIIAGWVQSSHRTLEEAKKRKGELENESNE